MARCLVTGHKGYIGSRLYKKLQELGHQVMGIDLKTEISHDIIDALAEGDDGLFHPHFYNFQPEYIFHLACWPRISQCLEKPVATMRNNVLAGSVILNFANKCKSVKRVIYSSSSSVHGNGDGPTNQYALQKLTTELETKIYSQIYDIDTVSLRYFNVYSEDQVASGPYATVVAHWRHSLLNGVQPYITGDGEQRRDMLHVNDAVMANIFAMEHEGQFSGEAFDVGTGENMSLNEIKDVIQELHDHISFDYIDERLGEIMISKADTAKLKKLGWKASVSLVDGIRECFDFEVKQ
jgi:UDP-glucose 4-epimerase